MASPVSSKKGTNQFMRMGHTSGPYGNDPGVLPMGRLNAPAKELKP